MSAKEMISESHLDAKEEQQGQRAAISAARLLRPAVTFGLRAAVLAGLTVVSVPAHAVATPATPVTHVTTNIALSGAPMNTTCCGESM